MSSSQSKSKIQDTQVPKSKIEDTQVAKSNIGDKNIKIEDTQESKSNLEDTQDKKSNLEESKSKIEDTQEEKSNLEDTQELKSKIEAEEEEEEEGECGFCLFMKGGGCKDSFIEWEKCIEEGEKNKEDIVEKCFEVTSALRKCMEVHSDYYAPILQAEKAAEAELEKEKEKVLENEGNDTGSAPSDSKLEGISSSS
ncbi:putative phosphate transporter PHO1 -like protein 10-like [Capsicum annuum]|nr:putative phosphate transporter PHO1 -like protein 10-like [Capsicum annuum]